MVARNFEYRSARTVEEAVQLSTENTGARYLAGGTDLLPQVRCGACLPPEVVVDIKRIPALWEIGEDAEGALVIGATARINTVASNSLIQERYPMMVDCCRQLGSYPLRNIATAAGNICNASPCADTSAALLALDAEVVAVGVQGERRIPIADFFQGPGTTALSPGELVTGLRLPAAMAGGRGHYGRIARRKGVDISTVAALVCDVPEASPRFRVSLLSVGPRPLRVPKAEDVLDAKGPAGAVEAGEIAQVSCSPISDVRASADYRRRMVGVLVQRGAEALAKGEGR